MFDNVRRVARQLVAYGTADVVTLAINALLLPFFLRPDVLTAAELGVFGVLLGWEAIIRVVFRLGLEGAFLRLYYDQPDDASRRRLAGTIAIMLGLANGAVLALLLALSGVIARISLSSAAYQWPFVLVALNCFVSGFLFLPMTLYRARQQAQRAMLVTLGRSLGTVLVRVVLVIGWRLGIVGMVLADLIVSAIVTLALSGTFREMLRFQFSAPLAREALRYGFPHVPFGLLHQAAAYADRFALGVWLPAARLGELGAYQLSATIASLLKLAPVAFQTAWMPFAFETYTRRQDAPALFGRLATYWLAVLVFLTIGVMTLSQPAIVLLLPADYWPAGAYVPLLALGVAIQAASWLPTTSLNIAKATRYYPIITAISAASAFVAYGILIPRYELAGAAMAMAAGQLVQLVATLVFSQRAYAIAYEPTRMTKIIVVGAGTWLVIQMIAFASPLWTLLTRGALLAVFPAGLVAARLFTPKERADLRALLASVTRPRPPRAAATVPPADETVL